MVEVTEQTRRFEQLTERWLPLAIGWARRLGGPTGDPHQVAADALLEGLWSWRDIDDQEARAAWLFARVRRATRRASWRAEGISGKVGAMPSTVRALWVLRVVEGLHPDDVTLLTGVSEARQDARLQAVAPHEPEAIAAWAVATEPHDHDVVRARAQLRPRWRAGGEPLPGIGVHRRRRHRLTVALSAAVAVMLLLALATQLAPPGRPLWLPGTTELAGVHLEHEGLGWVAEDADGVRVTWSRGVLSASVSPHGRRTTIDVSGRSLVVHPGGTLTLEPLLLGAKVDAQGPVYASCGSDGQVQVQGATVCLPEPAELLTEVVRLRQQGAEPTALLAMIDAVLPEAEPGPARVELLALQVSLLLEIDRPADALTAIDAYLAQGIDLRRADMEALAQHLREAQAPPGP